MNELHSTFVALWNRARSLSPLVPLMLVSLLLALLLAGGNGLVGASSLFQSPPEPLPREEPTATPPPPTIPPEQSATPVPTETPVSPPEPTATPQPAEATAAAPAETPPEEPSEGPAAPAETPAPPAEAPDEAPGAVEPAPETPEEPQGEGEAPPEESSSMIFNWGVFLNTVIVTLSYAWICCGVCGLVGTPLAFLLFYVWGKRRLRQGLEESEEAGQPPETDQTE
jgi:hypothetical protein